MKSFRLLIVSLCCYWMTGCTVNPVTGKSQLSLIPEGQEIAIGNEQYAPAQQAQGGLYSVDVDVGLYVNRVGQKLAAVSDRDLPYEFVVINDSTPNAWALPGGKIAINRGLLTRLGSEAELAAVLGHEIVHAAAGHSAQALQRGMILQGVLLATSIGVAASDNEYDNYVVGSAQIGAQLINQNYSREAELESDYYGMLYMKRAGYEPSAAVDLQQTFVELSEGREQNWLAGLFASHPPSRARVDKNRETATTLGAGGEIGAERYRQAMARLFDSEEAYANFDRSMGFAREGHLDDALSFINRAIDQEPAEARFYGLKGDILLEQKKHAAATTQYNEAIRRDDGYYEYYLGRGLARAELGERDAARVDLERSNELLPTAIANARLGELALAAGDRQSGMRYLELASTAEGEVGRQAKLAYLKLDVTERPWQYISARPFIRENGRIFAQVGNPLEFPVHKLKVEFSAVINGETQTREVHIPTVSGHAKGTIGSGLRVTESDTITNLSVRAIRAEI